MCATFLKWVRDKGGMKWEAKKKWRRQILNKKDISKLSKKLFELHLLSSKLGKFVCWCCAKQNVENSSIGITITCVQFILEYWIVIQENIRLSPCSEKYTSRIHFVLFLFFIEISTWNECVCPYDKLMSLSKRAIHT